jgi:hypothetical protein
LWRSTNKLTRDKPTTQNYKAHKWRSSTLKKFKFNSGGRGQEDCGLKPAQANSSQDPISKKSFTKIGLVERLKMKALSSSPSTAKKRKKRKQIQV